jgi:uronate dehydrogenase
MPTSSPCDRSQPVLLTGASGHLGRMLARVLSGRGWTFRLTDRVGFPDALPHAASFALVELADAPAIAALAEGCGTFLHFGGIASEAAFGDLLDANVAGVFNIYEAARVHGARVMFASSNHAVGFHLRSEALDADCALQPDSLYGLSKAYGELLAGLYWEKHAVQSVLVRIGSCFPEPRNDRMLSTWLSHRDLSDLVERAMLAQDVACPMIWGTSGNSRSWWRHDDRGQLDWQPQDSADAYAADCVGVDAGDTLAERYQGGSMCRRDNTRFGVSG